MVRILVTGSTDGVGRATAASLLDDGYDVVVHADLSRLDGTGAGTTYSDSKLYVTALMAAVARRRPDVLTHAVDPGWVPTKMGGPSASDDLALAHVTQAWLATTDDAEALVSGRYWHHMRTEKPLPAVDDEAFQDAVLVALAERTGVALVDASSSTTS